jgi:hypothetical protein
MQSERSSGRRPIEGGLSRLRTRAEGMSGVKWAYVSRCESVLTRKDERADSAVICAKAFSGCS